MLSLCLAVLSSSLVSIVMRISGNRVKHNLGMLTMNYIVCALLAAVFCNKGQVLPISQLSQTIALGMVNGVLYLAGFVLMQLNIRKNGVVLSSIFQKLGLLVTLVVSVVFYREIPDFLQSAGFLIAIAAIVVMNYQKGSANVSSKAGLIAMLLACGMAEAMSKIFTESGPVGQEPQFLFFTFATAMVLCWVLMLMQKQRIGGKEMLFGTLIAIPNFFSSKFLLGALESLAAVIVYPVFSVSTILAVTLTGVLLFRERLNRRQWAGMAAILVALVLLNI